MWSGLTFWRAALGAYCGTGVGRLHGMAFSKALGRTTLSVYIDTAGSPPKTRTRDHRNPHPDFIHQESRILTSSTLLLTQLNHHIEQQTCLLQQPNTSTSPTLSAAKCSASHLTTSRLKAKSPSLQPRPASRHSHHMSASLRLPPAWRASRRTSDEPTTNKLNQHQFPQTIPRKLSNC